MRQVALRAMRGRGGVDVCDRCGGVFLDFFDGEPALLSREITLHLERFQMPFKPGSAPLRCPDCERSMDVHPYLNDGPNIARCNRCLAMFATPEQIRALATFDFIEDPLPWQSRLLALLRTILA
jgi:hypothetical protein